MAMLSAFEILGPVMVGPSSSHTAGALRCAQVAASLMEAPVTEVRFTLFNSFSHTAKGHGTDRALVAGILGLDADDERIADAFELAGQRGVAFSFASGGDVERLHPNTVDIDMRDATGARLTARGESLGGGRVRLSSINGVRVDITGEYDTVFVGHRDVPGVLAALTVELSARGINIAFMRTYRLSPGGEAYTVFELDGAPEGTDPAELLADIRLNKAVSVATLIRVPGATRPAPSSGPCGDFSSASELLALCETDGIGPGEAMRRREAALLGADEADRSMRRVMETMERSASEPIRNPRPSLGGLIGGGAKRVSDAGAEIGPALMGAVQTDAVARAMAVLERSASMGVIVAAPTAGSAGVVPGSLIACADALGLDRTGRDAALANALWAAAATGLVLSLNATVSGAEGGCQAEVGSAAAMAASGLVTLMGGSPGTALDAASLALQNLLGLVCDPVGGLVEVPCQARNAIGVAAAFSSAQIALSGVPVLVPLDEMARVMLGVGRSLPASLRETARGGIAQAPSACRACRARSAG